MPKKKKKDEEIKKVAEKNLPYTVGEWKGMTKYECRFCPYDTLDKMEMLEHIDKYHTEKPQKEPLKVKLYDRFGNEIKEKEVS